MNFSTKTKNGIFYVCIDSLPEGFSNSEIIQLLGEKCVNVIENVWENCSRDCVKKFKAKNWVKDGGNAKLILDHYIGHYK